MVHGVPQPRLARERRAAARAARAAPRARPAPRLRRLAGLRRRGQDDRQGLGDPGVRRPDHRASSERRRPPRLRRAARAGCSRTTPRSTAVDGVDKAFYAEVLRREQLRRRRPAGAALLRLRQGPRRAARRDRPALRPGLRRGARRRRAGTRTSRRTTCCGRATGSAGSTSTCTRARGSTATPRSSTSPRASRAGSCPRACWSATSRAALMEHDHVVTLFHEFGHLVHHVLAGGHAWTRFSGVATEWDFVEAPSQMLEEWAWDADVLQSFATDADGEPIPRELVAQDARRQRVRQGALRPHPDVLRRAVLHAAPGRARRPHRDDARAAGALRPVRLRPGHATSTRRSATSRATARATTPTCGAW